MKNNKIQSGNPLWTKNFTILTLGSVVSMLGNSLSGFALSLLVLDYTKSASLYALFIILSTFPQLIMPIFSGAVLDRFSRRKTIYTLDFISAGIYLCYALAIGLDHFSFVLLGVGSFVIGSINSIYFVAFQSFYPLTVTEGNLEKAYSISSVLETVSTVMVPVSALIYRFVGIAPLLAMNSVCFLTAAILETRIDTEEKYIEKQKAATEENKSAKLVLKDIKEGFAYLIGERGLLMIAIYFGFSALSGGASSVITLPYFKTNFTDGEFIYMMVWGMAILGRALGGALWYKVKIPRKHRFNLALTSYICCAAFEGIYLFTNIPFMMFACLMTGLLGVTSYTIRSSSTQTYVPDEKKGRFNGAFNMLSTAGSLAGETVAGALVLLMPERLVLSCIMAINVAAALIFVAARKKEVASIYEITTEI